MSSHQYTLGPARYLEQLYPAPQFAPSLNFNDYADVIRHYTMNSLNADGIKNITNVHVTKKNDKYQVHIEAKATKKALKTFGSRHTKIFSKPYARKAIKGMELLKSLGVWNPMEGYHVNNNPNDGTSKWALFPPLGLNIMGQKGMTLMHYPPWAVLQKGTFDNAMTMQRWDRLLVAAGIPQEDVGYYKTFIDINPIAAPGSGESEYPNDYFPIMMASGFFDGPSDRDYIRSMLDLYLSPPDLPESNKYTLPLLICGSPLYDPQAPGWFRTAYTDILPQDKDGIPLVDVMQVGSFKVRPDAKRETPYLICNHMIAAGVTGKCTDDPSKIPDIRQYEAQDLVAATFLKIYAENPNIDPLEAKNQACARWYGKCDQDGETKYGNCAPNPPNEKDRQMLCALAQMDLFFVGLPSPHPKYTLAEAMERCKTATQQDNPCFGNIKPPNRSEA